MLKGDAGEPTDEQTQSAVDDYMQAHPEAAIDETIINSAVGDWLDEHPEATTTVLDGSLTESKFSDALKLKTLKDYVTPEMFGAVGDGTTDDSSAFTAMFDYIETVKVQDLRYGLPQVLLTKVYNVGVFSVPNNFYHDLMFIGGVIVGEMTFPSNSFYTLQFYGTSFRNSNGFALILNPNKDIEYKMCSFKSCNFISKGGVKTDTRSILVSFDTCTFQGCDFAYYGGDTDKLVFKNCWFDTKTDKSESELPYTIYINGANESACVVDSCIVVNATTTLGDYAYTAFVGTKGEVCFTNTRFSNEATTAFYAVEFLADTLEKLSTGHVTGCVFNGCDLGHTPISLLGIPSLISITGCMGNTVGEKIIILNSNLTDIYKIRPALRITIKDNSFLSFDAGKKYGNSNNASGVNITASLVPTIPFELYYAVNKNHQGQNEPLIVPLTDGYKYQIQPNNSVDLFKYVMSGQVYNDLYINGKVFYVKYRTQVQGANTFKSVMDAIAIDVSGGSLIITKTNVYGADGTVSYSISPDNGEYTISMTSSDRVLYAMDYGLFDNGFATI